MIDNSAFPLAHLHPTPVAPASSSNPRPHLGASTSAASAPLEQHSHSPESQSLSASSTAAGAAAARPFRSKKIRPCDACRKRKNRCAITSEGGACIECRQTNRQCTFDLPPPTRPKKDLVDPTSTTSSSAFFPPVSDAPSFHTSPPDLDSRITAVTTAALRAHKRPAEDAPVEPASKRASASQPGLASLDRDLSPNVEPCAVTATLTDDLLSHQTVGTSRQISSDRGRSQFILFHAVPPHRVACADREASLLRRIRSFLSATVPSLSEDDIVEHYLANIHPCMPVLPVSSSHSINSLPPTLRAIILVDSLGSFPQHKAASNYAWHMLKEERVGERALDQPKLSGLATAVLELGTTLDQRGDYGLLARTIAHAQLLGLHVDGRRWALPAWEKSLRDRIWWSLRIHDAWASFLNSRPSHVQLGNTNVPLLPFPTPSDDVESYVGSVAFQYSCRLAVIVARLQAEVSTLDKYGSPTRADSCDQLEHELNAMKEGARPFLDTSPRPIGMDSFLFSLFALRCMVRRISIEVRIGLGNTFAPDGSTVVIFRELVDFFSRLDEVSFGSTQPWLPYTSHILSSVLSSLIRLSLAAISIQPSPPSTADPDGLSRRPSTPLAPSSAAVHLLSRLSHLIYRARTDHGWTLADAALARASSVADRLSSAMQADAASDDYGEVIKALRRETPHGPASAPTAMAAGVAVSAALSSSSSSSSAPFEALTALAALAERPEGSPSAELVGGSVGGARPLEPTLSFFAGGAEADVSVRGPGVGQELDLPELEAWLNVLDRAPAWGVWGSPPGGGAAAW
ncbi:uncharacterized protein RHOBADRAFT_51724 [Rhodotorula graminis WP1]|uniref:Zn(2)-C6 fungal-type domain-containing protein n=1 Tax=Rhodotorula graminis (strain WP1) TaxID=578459 RepID=A0A194S8B7_RHOGW|nr:uncharacterized protein RHOBADRAFT_51724 [Rhodotorula graminis WP1]KPV76725.1 hypothetical protein RHOBADRAFT_51724 [Rhodotorula graminis WP1]